MPDDYTLRNDDDDVKANETDHITEELSDDPSKELGVPANELGAELNKYDLDNGNEISDDAEGDDRREEIEDDDEDGPSQD